MSEASILLREDKAGIAYLTLNAPNALNALSDAMMAELHTTLGNIADDSNIRCVILKGAGKAFCAGHDLKEMTRARSNGDKGKAYFKDLFSRCTALMLRIRTLPQPVIAQVHGIATAAGCQLVATCDLAIAEKSTRFGVNGVNIGLFCSTPMVALSRNISTKKTFEMLVTGDFIYADQAQELGLLNGVAEKGDLDIACQTLAEKIATKRSAVVKIGKTAFYQQLEMGLAEAYDYSADVMVQNMLYAETKEGIDAFVEKRKPNWPTQGE